MSTGNASLASASLRAFGALLSVLLVFATGVRAAEPYLIHPGDRLSVTVYGYPDESGVLQPTIGGEIVHPLAGSVPAVGRTIEEVQQVLADRLANFLPSPTVSVSIASYAPVSVLGAVEKPGEYAYRPGLTVLELIALAGGLRRETTLVEDGVLPIIDAQRELEEVSLRIFALQAAIARLESELAGEEFAYEGEPPLLVTKAEAQRIIEDERRLFDLRRTQRQSADRGLEAQVESYEIEIRTLEKSIKLHAEELALLKEDVDAARELVERGVSTPARLREMQRSLSATHRDSLEMRMYLARARQNRLEAERQRTEAAAEFRTRAAEALKTDQADLAHARLRLDALKASLGRLQVIRADGLKPQPAPPVVLSVVRGSGAEMTEIEADESTSLLPGDILRVTRPNPLAAVSDQRWRAEQGLPGSRVRASSHARAAALPGG